MNDADKNLSELLDGCASDGAEFFDDCGGEEDAIIAAFLRSSHADEAFSEIDMRQLNEMVACIFDKSTRIGCERGRVALVAYLTNLATDSARSYVDKVLPGKYHSYRDSEEQEAKADWQQSDLADAIAGIASVYYRFS
ncbi:MAG: hypothetical protein K6U74_00205 [Firmicutes bacterium]|nr:hypothetical protein [Bacillota bacterium]